MLPSKTPSHNARNKRTPRLRTLGVFGEHRIGAMAGVVVLACTLLLSGCSTTLDTPGVRGCVPLVSVSPRTVQVGGTITVVVSPGCNLQTPAEGWVIFTAPVGEMDQAVRLTVQQSLGAGFRTEMPLPASFAAGEAFAGLDGWDYSACPDNASCAGPTTSYTITD